jgi:4-hydroxy-4-methyl-2-oxoglutarate aldolase
LTQQEIIAALKELPTATLSEATSKPCDLPPIIHRVVPNACVVGPAFTVRCPLGDNTAVTRSVDQAEPGDVIIIDCGGPPRTAMWGETATFASQVKGIAGCVTNGAVRDIDAIVASGFPVFSAGLSLRGSTKGQPGETNVDIVIGDIVIQPGDFVCADADGVVVIPAADVDDVLNEAARLRADEQSRNERIKSGTPLAEILAESGNRRPS